MRVLYFAWLRERIGEGSETVTPPETVRTARDLAGWLAQRSPAHGEAFADLSAIRVAIDQNQCDLDDSIAGAAEVAFFPPVTGG